VYYRAYISRSIHSPVTSPRGFAAGGAGTARGEIPRGRLWMPRADRPYSLSGVFPAAYNHLGDHRRRIRRVGAWIDVFGLDLCPRRCHQISNLAPLLTPRFPHLQLSRQSQRDQPWLSRETRRLPRRPPRRWRRRGPPGRGLLPRQRRTRSTSTRCSSRSTPIPVSPRRPCPS
jgi:hypothetical protein